MIYTVTMINTTQLKRIADGLHALGKPPDTTVRAAKTRLALMEEFTHLVEMATPAERHDLVQVLKEMLREAA